VGFNFIFSCQLLIAVVLYCSATPFWLYPLIQSPLSTHFIRSNAILARFILFTRY